MIDSPNRSFVPLQHRLLDLRGRGALTPREIEHSHAEISKIITKHFDLRPAGIIKMLDLRRPIYKKTSSYGHFGREDADFTWERTDKAEELKQYLK